MILPRSAGEGVVIMQVAAFDVECGEASGKQGAKVTGGNTNEGQAIMRQERDVMWGQRKVENVGPQERGK